MVDYEQIPAVFSYPKCESAKPPLSLRSISPRGERALLSYGIGNQDCFERFYGDLIRRLRRHLPQRGKAYHSCPLSYGVTRRIAKRFPQNGKINDEDARHKALPRWGRGTAAEENFAAAPRNDRRDCGGRGSHFAALSSLSMNKSSRNLFVLEQIPAVFRRVNRVEKFGLATTESAFCIPAKILYYNIVVMSTQHVCCMLKSP